jgi:hypothetical protein
MWPKIWGLPMIAVAWALLGLAGAATASASPPSARVPVVLSARATPANLASEGGDVTVSGAVENAAMCQLQLLSDQSFSVTYSHNPRSCASGSFSALVTVGPNNTPIQRTIAFNLVASNGVSSSVGRFYVLLAPAKPSAVLSASVTPAKLGAAGGTAVIAATVSNATSCQLQLLSKQSFTVVYSHNPRSCASGSFSAKVTVGPNPTTVPRTIAFSLVATNLASDADDPFYISLAAAVPAAPAGPKSVVPKSVVPATASQPSVAASTTAPAATQSSNWSGYSTTGGPFTEAKGTFTVPSISAGTPPNDQVSEWVGVDGTNGSDSSLIQAGVDEYTDPLDPSAPVIQPWWEILPAAETNITTVAVKAGDSVTVTLWQVSTSTWEINLTDNTNGESYTTPPEQYSGPEASAEWIVEATTRCSFLNRCATSTLAPYSPAVAFSSLGMTGHEGALQEDTMVQNGTNVATPSALSSASFTVAYTGQQLFDRPATKAS